MFDRERAREELTEEENCIIYKYVLVPGLCTRTDDSDQWRSDEQRYPHYFSKRENEPV